MNQDIERFLNLVNMPARASVEQTAGLLGFSPHEIPILISRGLLKPLGHPAPNGQKFFLTEAMKELRRDEKWCGKASDAVSAYWRIKNDRKGNGVPAISRTNKGVDAPEFADAEN
jgi:hypothetical protein